MKVKDYYDVAYANELGTKIKTVYTAFDVDAFVSIVSETLEQLEFNDRQELLAKALYETLQVDYKQAVSIFTNILGPELEGSLGMFTEGYWLWPIGKYVELYGDDDIETTAAFSKELTKRFTSEFCMRPLIQKHPKESMKILLEWSKDDNKRVRRLASECIRIRLPWAKKLYVCLDYFDEYVVLLTNLKDDNDKTTQKSVANNLNDLYKDDVEKFEYIISLWSKGNISKECAWIIKHASRTKLKRQEKLANKSM